MTGSREKVVLETKATAEKKQGLKLYGENIHSEGKEIPLELLWTETKKPRPRYLKGYTYSIETPVGKAFITINENGGDQPFEVFVNAAKAGSDITADSEALGRLISYNLTTDLDHPAAPALEGDPQPVDRHRRRTLAGLRPQPRAQPAGWHRACAG